MKLPARGLAYVAQFTSQQIARRKQAAGKSDLPASTDGQDFISKLFRLQQEAPEKFPDSAVFTTCITNIGAGSDTTSISLCAIVNDLATHPSALYKVG